MKPKMKDNTRNELVTFHMIGQGMNMWDTVPVADIAAWMGVSKNTALIRIWRWVEQGYLVVHATEYRTNAMRYEVELTESGQEWAYSGAARVEYKRWTQISSEVRQMKPYDKKAKFV